MPSSDDSPALNAADIIEQAIGRRPTHDEWLLLMALPFVAREMEDEISKNEGSCCSVDKVFHRLAKSFLNLGMDIT